MVKRSHSRRGAHMGGGIWRWQTATSLRQSKTSATRLPRIPTSGRRGCGWHKLSPGDHRIRAAIGASRLLKAWARQAASRIAIGSLEPLSVRLRIVVILKRALRTPGCRRPTLWILLDFSAYPALIRDTVVFVPCPLAEFASLPAERTAAARDSAIEADLDALYDFATDWTRRAPTSSAAFVALADVLEGRGEIDRSRSG